MENLSFPYNPNRRILWKCSILRYVSKRNIFLQQAPEMPFYPCTFWSFWLAKSTKGTNWSLFTFPLEALPFHYFTSSFQQDLMDLSRIEREICTHYAIVEKKKFLLSSKNQPLYFPLTTTKMPYGTIFQPAMPETFPEYFYTFVESIKDSKWS